MADVRCVLQMSGVEVKGWKGTILASLVAHWSETSICSSYAAYVKATSSMPSPLCRACIRVSAASLLCAAQTDKKNKKLGTR